MMKDFKSNLSIGCINLIIDAVEFRKDFYDKLYDEFRSLDNVRIKSKECQYVIDNLKIELAEKKLASIVEYKTIDNSIGELQ